MRYLLLALTAAGALLFHEARVTAQETFDLPSLLCRILARDGDAPIRSRDDLTSRPFRPQAIFVPTGARTSLFVPEIDRLFVAAGATSEEPAAILVLRPVSTNSKESKANFWSALESAAGSLRPRLHVSARNTSSSPAEVFPLCARSSSSVPMPRVRPSASSTKRSHMRSASIS